MEFWELTPFELNLLLEVYIEKEEEKTELAMAQSWIMAALSRAKRMPGYTEFIGKTKKTKKTEPQSADEMLEKVKMLHTALGGD